MQIIWFLKCKNYNFLDLYQVVQLYSHSASVTFSIDEHGCLSKEKALASGAQFGYFNNSP